MRRFYPFLIITIAIVFVPACASFPQQRLDNQADKIVVKTKSTLTQELAKVFTFFKNSEAKMNKIMYRIRDDTDDIIYDAQQQYYEQNQN